MNAFIKLVSVVGTALLVGIGAIVILTGVTLIVATILV